MVEDDAHTDAREKDILIAEPCISSIEFKEVSQRDPGMSVIAPEYSVYSELRGRGIRNCFMALGK
jgi:hypothetical protein